MNAVRPFLRYGLRGNSSVCYRTGTVIVVRSGLRLGNGLRNNLVRSLVHHFTGSRSLFRRRVRTANNRNSYLLTPALSNSVRVLSIKTRRCALDSNTFITTRGGISVETGVRHGLNNTIFNSANNFVIVRARNRNRIIISKFNSLFRVRIRPNGSIVVSGNRIIY